MRTYRNILKIDFYVQVLLVGFPIVALPLGFIASNGELLIMALIDLLFIGGWQLLSALVLAIGYSDKLRMKYLLFATSYLLVAYFLPNYLGYSMGGAFYLLSFLSYCVGVWYLLITYRDFQRAKNQLESFWDLEV